MLKKSSFTHSTPCTAFQIDQLQRQYSRLKTEQRLNKVDIYDAEHGGGYGELSRAMAEQEETEAALEAAEYFLHEEGVTPMEGIPFSDCKTPAEERKLRRYFEIFHPSKPTELPVLGE